MITLDDIDALGMPRSEVYQLTSDAEGDDVERNRRIASAIASAVDTITNAYTTAGLTVPADNPMWLKSICVDIAVYRIFTRRSGEVPETHKSKYESALKSLAEAVSKVDSAKESSNSTVRVWTREPSLVNRIDAFPS